MTLSRNAAIAFYRGDKNGDEKLDFDEFRSIAPESLRANAFRARSQAVFDSIDLDKNGSVTLDEFFVWTLSYVNDFMGAGLESVFNRYDASNEGAFDSREFAQAAEDMGFGPLAHELFVELDPDGSGKVSHDEMVKSSSEPPNTARKAARSMQSAF